ncbi:MAG: tetratricopeptide repeat protein, partial [Lentisphaeria bacterium]|nr:tetratricopeptide repeat protein [Lentisphaeria bacterium]
RILENFQTVYLNTDLEKEDAQQQYKWRNAARIVFSTNRGGELAEALEKSLAEKPALKEYTMSLAFYYLTNARWKEAEDLLQTYLRDRKDKTNPAWVYQLRMFIYRQLQNSAKYLEAARSYIHYESDLRNTESTRWEIASEMIGQKDYDAAQRVLAQLRSFQALAYRMTLLHQLERYDQVYQITKLAVPMFARGERMKKREHTLDFLQIAAYAADEKGDLPMLETLYLTWLKDYPEDPLAANNLAYAYATRNMKLDEAEKLALIALKKDPESFVAQDTMAWIHYRAGRYTVAATYIEIAIASSKKENDGFVGAEILDHAGDIYLALNDKENARKYWELALKNSVSKKEKEQIRKKLAALNRNI